MATGRLAFLARRDMDAVQGQPPEHLTRHSRNGMSSRPSPHRGLYGRKHGIRYPDADRCGLGMVQRTITQGRSPWQRGHLRWRAAGGPALSARWITPATRSQVGGKLA
jgi:hypothetical protein